MGRPDQSVREAISATQQRIDPRTLGGAGDRRHPGGEPRRQRQRRRAAAGLALISVYVALAFLEITVEDFSALLVPTGERLGVDSVREFNRVIRKFWRRQLIYVGGLAAIGSWGALVFAVVMHKLGALGPAEKVYADPVSHYVFGFGLLSYALLATWEHREGLIDGFTKRYGLKRLVYMEFHERITDAIQRESNMKHWPRAWKVRLILERNPGWADLYDTLNN